ncbi:hypothetical protein ACFC5Z_22700 [Streptomyces sp. NPDC056004]
MPRWKALSDELDPRRRSAALLASVVGALLVPAAVVLTGPGL